MKQQLSDLDFASVARIQNLPAAEAAGQPVTFEQLNAAVDNQAWKDNVRVRAQANVNIASPGAAVDGINLAVGEAFLAPNQTDPNENGIYVFNGAAVPATRRADADTFEKLESAIVTVDEGTDEGTSWRQTQVNGAIGANAIVWVAYGNAAPMASEATPGLVERATQAEVDAGADDERYVTAAKLKASPWAARRYAANIGDGSATQYDVTHNLNSRDVAIAVYRNSSPWDDVGVDIERPDANTARIRFAVAPAANAFRVVVKA